MNKTELISEIINICDKAENYDKLMLVKVETKASEPSKEEKPSMSLIDSIVLGIGKKKVVEDTVSKYWASVSVSKNEDTGVVDIQSYESWAKKHVKTVPDYISKQEFLRYFDAELRSMYEEKRADALNRFEGEE